MQKLSTHGEPNDDICKNQGRISFETILKVFLKYSQISLDFKTRLSAKNFWVSLYDSRD